MDANLPRSCRYDYTHLRGKVKFVARLKHEVADESLLKVRKALQ